MLRNFRCLQMHQRRHLLPCKNALSGDYLPGHSVWRRSFRPPRQHHNHSPPPGFQKAPGSSQKLERRSRASADNFSGANVRFPETPLPPRGDLGSLPGPGGGGGSMTRHLLGAVCLGVPLKGSIGYDRASWGLEFRGLGAVFSVFRVFWKAWLHGARACVTCSNSWSLAPNDGFVAPSGSKICWPFRKRHMCIWVCRKFATCQCPETHLHLNRMLQLK